MRVVDLIRFVVSLVILSFLDVAISHWWGRLPSDNLPSLIGACSYTILSAIRDNK